MMERLTHIDHEGWYVSSAEGDHFALRKRGKIVDRLAAYEDTGLLPEEVNDAVVAAQLMAKSKVTAVFGVEAERVLELTQAEKDGRLVVLPCKVGDTVYKIPSETNRELNVISRKPELNRVYAQKVCRAEIYDNGVYVLVTCDGMASVHSAFFGVDWFLTREEAEAALTGEGGKDGD